LKAFKEEMSFLTEQCLKNPPIDDNNKVRMPGQTAINKRKKSINEGIFLSMETNSTLKEISNKFELTL
jgi:LDH2 family malate/lactate/ureidoglycolate dehydrogenase